MENKELYLCEHLKGVVYYGNDDVEVECDLDEEDEQ